MRFLTTLFWVLAAVLITYFATRNWSVVTLNLWGDIQADIKLPVLLLTTFLLGLIPTWLVMRARTWGLKRRIEALERTRAAELVQEASVQPADTDPVL